MAANKNALPEPWERLPKETARAFEAFIDYRDSGTDRSIRSTAQKLCKNRTTIAEWCKKYNWVERAVQYDAELDRQARERNEKEREEMAQLHIKAARAMLTKALKGLQAIPDDAMTPNDVSRMIEVASKLERLSRGEPSESTEMFGREGTAPLVQIYLPTNGREKESEGGGNIESK
ncbi:MAG: hypothetical protein GX800_12990 [Clostridiaceae bacterium]|nr:hypothetical protein [Clostridiaceae bacterium]